jgi:transcriptional antiterminator
MARTSKLHQYAIYWLNSQGSSIDSIATELDLTDKQVAKVLEKNNSVNETNNIKTNSSPVNSIKTSSKDLMIRHTSAKKNNSVAIMTKEASEVNDQAKKNNQTHPNLQKNIFRPNG